MKKCLYLALLMAFTFVFVEPSYGIMTGKEAHERYLYPVVRVTIGNVGGSGTIVYSKGVDGKFSTYVLTNHHILSSGIKIEEKWDSGLKKDVKTEQKSVVYVEIFKYKDLGVPVGTLMVESDIIIYNELSDLALLKLRLTEEVPNRAKLSTKDKAGDYHLFDETVAVGCSLGFPPIATPGIINRKNFQINSLPFHMSTSQIIYGNSGGAMFLSETGQLIGIPALLPVVGWGAPITHMGLFIPIDRIYEWLEKENYEFIFDSTKNEENCLKMREERLKPERKKNND